MLAPRTALAGLILWLLLLSAGYEAVLALRWVQIGLEPGSDAPGAAAAVICALLAMAAAAVLLAVRPSRLSLLLPPAAVLVVLIRLYAFDPYYAPALRRFGDGGLVSVWWVVFLALASILCALRRWLAPAGIIVLVLAAGTLLLEGAGH